MKRKTIRGEILIAAMFVLPVAFANVEIKSDMQAISDNYTTLGKQIDDPALNASSKEIIDTMISSSKQAEDETPTGAQKAKGAKKEKIVENYKKDMAKMISKLEDMQDRLDASDNVGARKIYDELKPWTKPDHAKKYK